MSKKIENIQRQQAQKFSKQCQFCRILQLSSETNEKTLLYKDEYIFAFHDIDKSSAKQHILVCTTDHIQTALDVPYKQILFRMREIGVQVLNQLSGENKNMEDYRFGFHLRPYNSIDHIHLHGFVLPFTSFLKDKIVYGKLLTSIYSPSGQIMTPPIPSSTIKSSQQKIEVKEPKT